MINYNLENMTENTGTVYKIVKPSSSYLTPFGRASLYIAALVMAIGIGGAGCNDKKKDNGTKPTPTLNNPIPDIAHAVYDAFPATGKIPDSIAGTEASVPLEKAAGDALASASAQFDPSKVPYQDVTALKAELDNKLGASNYKIRGVGVAYDNSSGQLKVGNIYILVDISDKAKADAIGSIKDTDGSGHPDVTLEIRLDDASKPKKILPETGQKLHGYLYVPLSEADALAMIAAYATAHPGDILLSDPRADVLLNSSADTFPAAQFLTAQGTHRIFPIYLRTSSEQQALESFFAANGGSRSSATQTVIPLSGNSPVIPQEVSRTEHNISRALNTEDLNN